MSDSELNIITDDSNQHFPALTHYHRYEASGYSDLEKLVDFLREHVHHDQFIDFGSGLMRVPIYIHHSLHIPATGIELNKALYLKGEHNIEQYRLLHHAALTKDELGVQSMNLNVLDYQFSGHESILFFFNPFSAEIFRTIIHRFLSAYPYKRRAFVILYYAKHEYIDILSQFGLFNEIKRIELDDYIDDAEDMIIIYQIG
ncbi:class I SAM-dependent methyltransferase [Macrococcus hajekii]|uniref:Class I SAM-dependent methyltransferase n=1 Tax=Macrococcus hajekii TaxID=198482 RepID=A0A4R6BMQ5_9STAP|nr:class I SAM-dependent methyltransferase [Macrococcus hajekii]TDM02947.1 class I SAM-dependent methyltransferase [Macrococcus hajekii]GGB05181.1 methyltransferase [Macrococcus hajekii]